MMNAQEQRLWKQMLARSWEPHQWWDRDQEGQPETQREGLNGSSSKVGDSKHSEGVKAMWLFRPARRKEADESESDGFEVGYFDPNKQWCPVTWHEDQADAEEKCHYLNGGN